jgi:LemA protein
MTGFLIGAIIIAIFAYFSVRTYKELVELRELRKSAVSELDKALINRYNVMENMIIFSKDYIEDQNRFVVKLLQARLVPVEERTAIEKELVEELGKLISMISDISELTNDKKYTTLKLQLAKSEKIIFEADEAFNDRTVDYDRVVKCFPKSMVAKLAGFKAYPIFEVEYLTR